MPVSLNEASLEELIVDQMVAATGSPSWVQGDPADFNAQYCLDIPTLTAFIADTQPDLVEALALNADSPTTHKFLARLQGEITKQGIVACLRNGISHGPHHVDLYCPTPTPGNAKAAERFASNRLTITRQVHYSPTDTGKSLDLMASVNGLPIATLELKNQITKQNVQDAVDQYKLDRDPRELLFQLGRCMAHFAVDDARVRFCTKLAGTKSWFLPFDRGYHGGAGNPPNPDGIKTEYLWKQVLAPKSLANIIENFAAIVHSKDTKTGKKTASAIFPRFHQLDVVRTLLSDVESVGSGKRYLIQHSAGSGKSNSIAWLAHQLVGVEHAGSRAFDSIIVVTDRVILDGQIRDTIKGFTQVGSTVAHAESAKELRTAIEAGRKIIITTVQKFPFIVRDLGGPQRDKNFAIIIDEAHSSQGGKVSAALAQALSKDGLDHDVEDVEDALNKLMASKKMLPNASYFAFTATPKNKTLETFGEPFEVDGVVKHRPFHSYTMKQATQEKFILDVLANYIPVDTYYKLIKTVEDDPEFDAKRASQKLRTYVESQKHAIRQKAEIMVDHFHAQVYQPRKIGGQARAMVVTTSIARAIDYYEAVTAYLSESKRPYKAIVAFSDFERDGVKVTEAQYNGFPGSQIASQIREDPYRLLIVADKFQTGYDEPLLHTMYVDKPLSGVKAVQTLSRLNRAHPLKNDCAVLDFANDSETIEESFQAYYQTTVLADETDPNKLNDLTHVLDASGIYTPEDVDLFVERYLTDAPIDDLHPLLDACVAEYLERDEDDQVEFKGSAKAFVRTYGFLSAVLPYSNAAWEKLSIFLGYLVPKLPSPKQDDLSEGVLETIDLDSFRAEKREAMKIALQDEDAELDPVPTATASAAKDPELQRLTEILDSFNAHFGNIPWEDRDRIMQRITEEVPKRVAQDEKYQLAIANSGRANARVEMARALQEVMFGLLADETQLYKQFSDNESFRKWLEDSVFRQTYKGPA
ncbi:type I restriction endonuclease subunit R [Demequina sp. NBRC 110051]|uniref:type I restriction endonuclease subunit R n=1 Tax=Demequina sp. NBRC 110051 TaxID=1570340 RepID=UPI0009FFE174|nr:type I restriction endonuclease subunit R [Demequina sp. NBRC 110051]